MSTKLILPKRFTDLLDQHSAMGAVVKQAETDLGAWLAANQLQFFTEYTDHGLAHVNEVLATTAQLVRPECANMLTPQDAATLTLAALLHDAAMHITADGLYALLDPERTHEPIDGFDDPPWPKLWEDFFAEARRFSGRKLIRLFGTDDPIQKLPDDSADLTGRYALLAGEFLRRHHHRLAHEIARRGVPGPDPADRLEIRVTDDTRAIVDLAGLVARSHGMPMRACLPYLETRFHVAKKPAYAHGVLLMALLRIADILQIERDRAPWQRRKLSTLKSPISKREWAMHQAIAQVDYEESPETVTVVAEPRDVETYLRVRDQLTWIQKELDDAWIVLGEVYGHDPEFREIGLTLRRVRSNLDDAKKFGETVDFIPCKARFDVADSDLLKLLIGPLYGHNPEIGIRELLQNALDAVRELRAYLKTHPNIEKRLRLPEHDGDVRIDVAPDEEGQWWVTVSDQGIGMTVDTIRDYFLKAGASFRRSDDWKKTFEEDGRSRVLRSGRFGVGALAAYLLGDRIQVSTCHAADFPRGTRFEASIDDDAIELRRWEADRCGTTVRVALEPAATRKLDPSEKRPRYALGSRSDPWDWYVLDDPSVERWYDGEERIRENVLPTMDATLPDRWRRIAHPSFRDIHWTWTRQDDPISGLVCNGLYVSRSIGSSVFRDEYWSVDLPALSVFDFDAAMPLNLQRTGVSRSDLPFDPQLRVDIWRDFLAWMLVRAPTELPSDAGRLKPYLRTYPGVRPTPPHAEYGRSTTFPKLWLAGHEGCTIAHDPWHVSGTWATRALFVGSLDDDSFPKHGKKRRALWLPAPIADGSLVVTTELPAFEALELATEFLKLVYVALGWKPRTLHHVGNDTLRYGLSGMEPFRRPGGRVLMPRRCLDLVQRAEWESDLTNFSGFDYKLEQAAETEWEDDHWVLWRLGDCPAATYDFQGFAAQHPGDRDDAWLGVLAEWNLGEPSSPVEPGPLALLWQDLLGDDPFIPHDPAARREKFPRAFAELSRYVERHERMAAAGEPG